MDNGSGGQNLTDAGKRQQTAALLARKKVLEAYRKEPGDDATVPVAPAISTEEWRRYHTAWQNYYQKYYGDYYGRVAQDYVAREKMRLERERNDRGRNGGDAEEEEARAEAVGAVSGGAGGVSSAGAGVGGAVGAGEVTAETLAENARSEAVQETYRERIRRTAERRAKKSHRKRRFWAPLVVGALIILVGVFLQYNQLILGTVMAYMSPGGNNVNEITEIDPTVTKAVHEKPTLMIPRLNVEVPVAMGGKNDAHSMLDMMSQGVAQFAVPGASAVPGQIGNFAVAGHSSASIYAHSQYKFIFSGLMRLENEDLIYMDYEGQRYSYKVIGNKTVEPDDVASLQAIADENSGRPLITLITCTPVGTARYRYLLFAEQVYPNYKDAPTTPAPSEEERQQKFDLPTDEPRPFERFWGWLTG